MRRTTAPHGGSDGAVLRIARLLRLGTIAAALVVGPPAEAAVFVVDDPGTTNDVVHGDGVCADATGRCTWRAAVFETNALPGPDVIALPAGTYAGIDLTLDDEVEVVGQGVGNTILDGEGVRQAIYVSPDAVATIRGVTFANGAESSGGGAILNLGSLTVQDCAFMANTAFVGGAISSEGTLTVERTTFSGNSASAGGGIFTQNMAVSTVRDSTFSGNDGTANASAIHVQGSSVMTVENVTITGNLGGAAIILASSADLTMTHVTVSDSETDGLVINSGTTATVANSIIAANGGGTSSDDCFVAGTLTSLGGNLSSDTSCNFDDPTDLESTDPGLLALADNGGPTRTIALAGGSAALDGAVLATCLPTDQRGAPRPAGSSCDRGAFESGGEVPTTTTSTFPTTTSTLPTTTSSSTTTFSTSSTTSSTSSTISSTSTSSTSLPASTTSTMATTTSSSTSTSSTTVASTSTSVTTSTAIIGTTTSTTMPGPATFLPGRKLLVKQKKSGAQRLKMVAKDGAVTAALPCGVDGELVIEAVGAAAPSRRVLLEASQWKPLKAKKPERGCRYRDDAGGIRVVVKAAKALVVISKADDLSLPLGADPRPVRIEVRHGDARLCLEFGGVKGKHVPDKKLVSKQAPAATTCPDRGSASGAFVGRARPGRDQSDGQLQ